MLELYSKITITIVLYQESLETISKSLENLKSFKIIIIDNANDLNLKNKVLSKFNVSKYIVNKKNLGFSKATNQAIKLSNSEYVLNLQADCIIWEKDILKPYEVINKYEDCIIVTPTFYNNKLDLTYNGGPLPEKKIKIKTLNLEGDTCVDIATTAAILFKKKNLIEIGLFDEDFFIYFPDFEIGRRIMINKKSIIQVYQSKATHEMGILKIRNKIKKTFFRYYFYTLDELIYYHKSKNSNNTYYFLKKKIFILSLKFIWNFLIFRFVKSTEYFARILAFYRFKIKYVKKNT